MGDSVLDLDAKIIEALSSTQVGAKDDSLLNLGFRMVTPDEQFQISIGAGRNQQATEFYARDNGYKVIKIGETYYFLRNVEKKLLDAIRL